MSGYIQELVYLNDKNLHEPYEIHFLRQTE